MLPFSPFKPPILSATSRGRAASHEGSNAAQSRGLGSAGVPAGSVCVRVGQAGEVLPALHAGLEGGGVAVIHLLAVAPKLVNCLVC